MAAPIPLDNPCKLESALEDEKSYLEAPVTMAVLPVKSSPLKSGIMAACCLYLEMYFTSVAPKLTNQDLGAGED